MNESPNQPTPTPRTDSNKFVVQIHNNGVHVRYETVVTVELSEQLECELANAIHQISMDTETIERIRNHGYKLEAELSALKQPISDEEVRKAVEDADRAVKSIIYHKYVRLIDERVGSLELETLQTLLSLAKKFLP